MMNIMKNNKIILYIATSLDGYISRKNGSVDWLDKYNNAGHDYGYKEFYDSVDTVIVGNTTHEQFPQEYNGKSCFVFSRNSKASHENITFVRGDVKKFMEKVNPQGTIWLVGGADLVNQFLKYDLIDEFIISIMPEFIGDGIPLFKKMDFVKQLNLVGSNSYGSVVQVHYKNHKLHK